MMRQLLVKQSSVVRNGSCSAKFRDCYALLQFDFIRIGGVWMYVCRALNCTTKWICIRQSRSHTVRRTTYTHRVNDIDILHSILELPCTANGWDGWGWMNDEEEDGSNRPCKCPLKKMPKLCNPNILFTYFPSTSFTDIVLL